MYFVDISREVIKYVPINETSYDRKKFHLFCGEPWIADDLAHTQLHAVYIYDGKIIIWLFEKELAKSVR